MKNNVTTCIIIDKIKSDALVRRNISEIKKSWNISDTVRVVLGRGRRARRFG